MGITITIINDWTDITILIPAVIKDKKGFVRFLFPFHGSEYLEPAIRDIIRSENKDRPDDKKYYIENLYKGVSKQTSFNINDCLSTKRANDASTAKLLLEEISKLLQIYPCSIPISSLIPPLKEISRKRKKNKARAPRPYGGPRPGRRLAISPAITAPRSLLSLSYLCCGGKCQHSLEKPASATFIGWKKDYEYVPDANNTKDLPLPYSRHRPQDSSSGVKTKASAAEQDAKSVLEQKEPSSTTSKSTAHQPIPALTPKSTAQRSVSTLKTPSVGSSSASASVSSSMISSLPHTSSAITTQTPFTFFPPPPPITWLFPTLQPPFSFSSALTNTFIFFNNQFTPHNPQGTPQTPSSGTCSCSSTSTSMFSGSNPNP